MTSTLRSVAAAAASVVLLISLAACTGGTPEPAPTDTATTGDAAVSLVTHAPCGDDSGATVVVDSSALEGGALEEWCVSTSEAIGAADALALAGIDTEGTEEYGDQVVCRVDGVPAEDAAIPAEDGSDYFETCASMPAAFAYWSLWVQPAGGEWGYAQEGLSTLQLEPGDSVELLFSLHGKPAEPAAPTS